MRAFWQSGPAAPMFPRTTFLGRQLLFLRRCYWKAMCGLHNCVSSFSFPLSSSLPILQIPPTLLTKAPWKMWRWYAEQMLHLWIIPRTPLPSILLQIMQTHSSLCKISYSRCLYRNLQCPLWTTTAPASAALSALNPRGQAPRESRAPS